MNSGNHDHCMKEEGASQRGMKSEGGKELTQKMATAMMMKYRRRFFCELRSRSR
jgi:hypothetical protein